MRPPSRRHVSFADGVTMLGDVELPGCSTKAELLPLIVPVVVEDSSVVLVEELIELVPSALGSSLPPPPGFSPFAWTVNDGGIDILINDILDHLPIYIMVDYEKDREMHM